MASNRLAPTAGPIRDFVDQLSNVSLLHPDRVAYTFLADGEDDAQSLTYGELDRKARAIAQQLLLMNVSGERALLLFPPGLDFVVSLFGCFYAGVAAVPAYPPRRNRNMIRIQAIARDARAKLAITVGEHAERVARFLDDAPELKSLHWLASDKVDDRLANDWRRPEINSETLAVLQYTSGSTGDPKGVMLSHGNIVHNCDFITHAFSTKPHDVIMSWLPTYHDMGLVGGVLNPMLIPCRTILMSPTSFLQKPSRWLKAITRHGVTISGGPNFAYDVCTKKVTAEEMQGLDLSRWTMAFNGAEPVRAATLQNFTRKFAAVGFRPEAFYPCYGMAESTLMITGGERSRRPLTQSFHGPELDSGWVVPVAAIDPNARQLVGCGQPPRDGTLMIVNPQTGHPSPRGAIGEIWVAHDGVGKGYLNKPEATRETFQARLADDDGNHYLRTGDLGFFFHNQLFVTGRIKDLIVVRGVNRYPQDIELTVEHSDTRLRTGAAAAFAVDMLGREHLIIVCEVERIAENNWDEVIGAIRRTVTATHELPPDGIILIRAGSIPKTSSGKIQRHACRAGFLDGSLMVIAAWRRWEQSPGDAATDEVAANTHNLRDIAENHHQRTPRNGHPAGDDGHDDRTSLQLVLDVVKQVAQERASAGNSPLGPDTNLLDLGLDSLERMEIANRLEDELGGVFPESVLVEIDTCGRIAEAIQTHFGGGANETTDISQPVSRDAYDIAQFPEYMQLRRTINSLAAAGITNPYFRQHEGVTRDVTIIEGRQLINFASYNYLGMSGHPRVTAAAEAAARNFGTSCSASRVVSGEKPLHIELEQEIAAFVGTEAALTFVGGHATNETTIGRLCGPRDLILHDALAHNSLMQGALLSGARRRQFPHNDWRTLEMLLGKLRHQYRRVLIIVEGVYSMDGDFPELPEFVRIKKKFHSLLMVDEAHSLGTMGKSGRGIGEHFGINPADVDVWMGTLSKSLGSCGGYIAGCAELIELLKYTAPGFVYSVGLSPPNASAALAALRELVSKPELTRRCQNRASQFLRHAREAGLETGNSGGTPIIPIIIGSSSAALRWAEQLFARGINVQPILYPAVEERAARLRFFVTSEHSESQIEETVGHLQEISTADLASRTECVGQSGPRFFGKR